MPLEEKYLSLLHALIPETTPDALLRLDRLYDRVVETNQKINITSLVSPMDVVLKHFADSLSLLHCPTFIPAIHQGKKACDIGCGGGFPGLPVACLYPHLSLTMIDSTEKKITYLQKNAAALGLSGVVPVWGRGEELCAKDGALRETFALCFSRAVARLSVLCELCLPFLEVGGMFFAMKGTKGMEELDESRRAIPLLGGKVREVVKIDFADRALDLSLFSAEEKGALEEFLSAQRVIIVIEKTKKTPLSYPRAWGKMTKKAL